MNHNHIFTYFGNSCHHCGVTREALENNEASRFCTHIKTATYRRTAIPLKIGFVVAMVMVGGIAGVAGVVGVGSVALGAFVAWELARYRRS